MDDLKLPALLILIWDIKRSIEKNVSIHDGIKVFLLRAQVLHQDKFFLKFSNWWINQKKLNQINGVNKPPSLSNTNNEAHLNEFSPYQRVVLQLLELGLSGQPIYEALKQIETDYLELCESDIQEHAAKLPIILQFPLVFLIFPAICMLIIVPTLSQLTF